MQKYPKVSVIVPVYNGEKTIRQCIDSLLKQDYPNYEVIIADNNSTDNTSEIIKNYSVQLLIEKKRGSSAARNTGAKIARGKILAFTDSDCILRTEWLRKLTEPIIEGTVATLGGTISAGKSKLEMIEQKAYENYLETIKKEKFVKTVDTRNFAIKKGIFQKIGGFDEKVKGPEDTDFGLRLVHQDYKIYFVNNAPVKHFHKTSFNRIIKVKYWQNYWLSYIYDKKGLSTDEFRLNYKLAVFSILCFALCLILLFINMYHLFAFCMLVSIFCLLSSNQLLKSLVRMDIQEIVYHLLSVISVRVGIISYLITSKLKK